MSVAEKSGKHRQSPLYFLIAAIPVDQGVHCKAVTKIMNTRPGAIGGTS